MLRIAAAQSLISPDIAANATAIGALMRAAAAQGSGLVQFPEGALSGYPKAQIRDWAEVDWAALDRAQAELAALARELGIWAVIGTARRAGEALPRNSLLVLNRDGALAGVYDKRLLSASERQDWFTAGTSPLLFSVEGVRFGCALCIEVQFPELFAEYAEMGADVVLLSSYSDDPMFGLLARAHAATRCLWLGYAPPAQCAHAVPAQVIGPNGAILAQGGSLAVIDLDHGDPAFDVALTKARPWRAAQRALLPGRVALSL